jgi:hypothetical protein
MPTCHSYNIGKYKFFFSQKFFLGVVAKSLSFCNISDLDLRSSMSMEDLLNHIDYYITEHVVVDP